jgi:hypothetical protein
MKPPPFDPWEPGVRASDVPIVDTGEPPFDFAKMPEPEFDIEDFDMPEPGETGTTEPPAADSNDKPANDIDTRNVPQITVITKRDTPALMSKRIYLDGDGKLKSDGSECRMISGTATRTLAGTASALARIIAGCGSDQAIALGALKVELPDSVDVTVPNRLDKHPGAITRSRSCIDYRPGVPAWCLIDFDTKGMPDEVKTKIDAGRHVERAVDGGARTRERRPCQPGEHKRRIVSQRHRRADRQFKWHAPLYPRCRWQ